MSTPQTGAVKTRVTPQMAAKLLNTTAESVGFVNRGVSKATVAKYAHDMKLGHWFVETGETIKLAQAEDGTEYVVDGQHRLHAVLQSNQDQDLYLYRYVPVAAFQYIDQGLTRTLTHILQISDEGWAYKPSVFASAGRLLWRYAVSADMLVKPQADDMESDGNIAEWLKREWDDLPSFYREMEGMLASVERGRLGAKGIVLALMAQFTEKDPVLGWHVLSYLTYMGERQYLLRRLHADPANDKLQGQLEALTKIEPPSKGFELAVRYVTDVRTQLEAVGEGRVQRGQNADLMTETVKAYIHAWNRRRTDHVCRNITSFRRDMSEAGSESWPIV